LIRQTRSSPQRVPGLNAICMPRRDRSRPWGVHHGRRIRPGGVCGLLRAICPLPVSIAPGNRRLRGDCKGAGGGTDRRDSDAWGATGRKSRRYEFGRSHSRHDRILSGPESDDRCRCEGTPFLIDPNRGPGQRPETIPARSQPPPLPWVRHVHCFMKCAIPIQLIVDRGNHFLFYRS
jgi:hypothetical protein